jgi:hypothetical protein
LPGAGAGAVAGCTAGLARGAAVGAGMGFVAALAACTCNEAKDCTAIAESCRKGCSDFVLQKPRRRRTDWGSGDDFFKCVRRCLDREGC